jgi:basic membrane protein A
MIWLTVLVTMLALLSACGATNQPTPVAPVEAEFPATTEPTPTPIAAAEAPAAVESAPMAEPVDAPAVQGGERYGLAANNINDGGFNQLAYQGLQRAAEELGVEVKHLQTTDDLSNVDEVLEQFAAEGFTGIFTMGFDMSEATKAASLAHPNINYISVDSPSRTAHDLGILFDVDGPAFMAGYLAAGMTETGTVCTFGGKQLTPVLAFMVAFESGINYYNTQNNANVALLGWQTDPANVMGGEGIFADRFDDPETGKAIAEDLFSQGCDIIFPVAGGTSMGAHQAALDNGLKAIGVDADQTQTEPELAEVYLTSVTKNIELAVLLAIQHIHSGQFVGGKNWFGTLENNGVGLAPFHSYEDKVPQQLKDDLAQIEQGLRDGSIATGWPVFYNPVKGVAESTAATDNQLTPAQLQNATYSGIYDEPVTLTDGLYEGELNVEGDASRPMVWYMNNSEVYGDLNGDGVDDAVVFLVESGGGSGNFVYVAAQLNQNGQPVDAGAVWIEDRIQIISAAIEEGQVNLEITAEGPGDAACCKSHKTSASYALQDGRLTQLPGEAQEPERISVADLAGTNWTLLELDVDQPAPPDTEVTLSFTQDQLSGFGGCNNYSGSFSLSDDNPFVMTIGPVASTQMACPEPILNQETAYLTALQNVSQWGYLVGKLALSYDNGQGGYGTLLFAPAAGDGTASTEVTATEVIAFVPAEIPTDTQSGSCFAGAIGLGRDDAYRCTVGNQIYDPCFVVDDIPTVVCGANPATGETGFMLDLTEPLPAPEPGNLAQPWLIELADGQVCGLMTGTVVGVDDRIAPYGCPDGSYLFQDFQQEGDVWLAEKAVIGVNDNGYFIEASEMVPIRTVWQ